MAWWPGLDNLAAWPRTPMLLTWCWNCGIRWCSFWAQGPSSEPLCLGFLPLNVKLLKFQCPLKWAFVHKTWCFVAIGKRGCLFLYKASWWVEILHLKFMIPRGRPNTYRKLPLPYFSRKWVYFFSREYSPDTLQLLSKFERPLPPRWDWVQTPCGLTNPAIWSCEKCTEKCIKILKWSRKPCHFLELHIKMSCLWLLLIIELSILAPMTKARTDRAWRLHKNHISKDAAKGLSCWGNTHLTDINTWSVTLTAARYHERILLLCFAL